MTEPEKEKTQSRPCEDAVMHLRAKDPRTLGLQMEPTLP